jgi:hypothetical protein
MHMISEHKAISCQFQNLFLLLDKRPMYVYLGERCQPVVADKVDLGGSKQCENACNALLGVHEKNILLNHHLFLPDLADNDDSFLVTNIC